MALWKIKDNGQYLIVASTALSFELDTDITGNIINLTWYKTNLNVYKIFTSIYTGQYYSRHSFDPKNFDADFITDLALEAEMKYINITACHHEGFCLWKKHTTATMPANEI